MVVKHQGEATALSQSAAAGDMSATKKLQELQLKIIREWMVGSSPKSVKSATKPRVKP